MTDIIITRATTDDDHDIAAMVGELLTEISRSPEDANFAAMSARRRRRIPRRKSTNGRDFR